jgi:phospholipase/lecithinase/hemolysin
MQQWVAKEDRAVQQFTDREMIVRRNNTIHVISFGIWDIWHLIGQDFDSAQASANRSINGVFDQLHTLADKWDPLELKIILTLTIDLTFLPGFEPTAQNHKKTVALVRFWNEQLRNQAEQWDRGTIFLFDTNAFMLDQIRERQLYVAGLNDEVDPTESNTTDWHDVSSACVKNNGTASAENAENCSNPEQFLFW